MPIDHEAWLAANTFYCPRLKARLTRAACDANQRLPIMREKIGPTSPSAPSKRLYQPFACEGCQGPDAAGNVAAREEAEMRPKVKRTCLHCKRERPIVGRGLCGTCYPALKKAGTLAALYPALHAGGRTKHEGMAETKQNPAEDSKPQQDETKLCHAETIGAKPETQPDKDVREFHEAEKDLIDSIAKLSMVTGLDVGQIIEISKRPTLPDREIVELNFSQHQDLLEALEELAKKEVRDLPGQIIWELKRATAIATLPPCAYFPKRDSTDASGAIHKEGLPSAG